MFSDGQLGRDVEEKAVINCKKDNACHARVLGFDLWPLVVWRIQVIGGSGASEF